MTPTILAAEGIGKVRMIEDVEEFGAELHVEKASQTSGQVCWRLACKSGCSRQKQDQSGCWQEVALAEKMERQWNGWA